MMKSICLTILIIITSITVSCSKRKATPSSFASKKIMTVTEAVTFINTSTDSEGKEIIITSTNRGLVSSNGSAASLLLSDEAGDDGKKTPNNSFNACFCNEAADYARAVPHKATVTISGTIRHRNGTVQLENCTLIAQN